MKDEELNKLLQNRDKQFQSTQAKRAYCGKLASVSSQLEKPEQYTIFFWKKRCPLCKLPIRKEKCVEWDYWQCSCGYEYASLAYYG